VTRLTRAAGEAGLAPLSRRHGTARLVLSTPRATDFPHFGNRAFTIQDRVEIQDGRCCGCRSGNFGADPVGGHGGGPSMKKCCGTCRFYQKGPMTGAGWCLHPDRIDIRSDLVLERASHLGCRRSWDEHSWEPIPDGDRAGDRFDRVRPIGPVPPASPAEIGSILEAERRAIHAAQQGHRP
jgi:hypothetical protein